MNKYKSKKIKYSFFKICKIVKPLFYNKYAMALRLWAYIIIISIFVVAFLIVLSTKIFPMLQ